MCVLCATKSIAASDSSKSAVEEELVLNAVAAAHNLVYASQPDNGLWVARLQLLPLLVRRLFDSNAAIVAEAASALANLCVADDVRVAAVRNRALQACVMLLDHSDVAVCCAVCGLIMNVSANPVCAAHLLQARAHFKLVEAAVAHGCADINGNGGTSSTACRALANVRDFIDCPFNCYNVGQVLAQGSGGCIGRSFAEPAARALAEVLQQLHDAPGDSGKLFQEMESVLRLLKGPGSLEIIDDEECENEGDEEEQAQPESSDELEEI